LFSHNWLSGLRGDNSADLGSLVAAWPCLHTLALANTSDKHGSLALPQQLAGCSNLQELMLGSNYDLDWASLQVLAHCTVRLREVLPEHLMQLHRHCKLPAGL
jgi:hypothetical protein